MPSRVHLKIVVLTMCNKCLMLCCLLQLPAWVSSWMIYEWMLDCLDLCLLCMTFEWDFVFANPIYLQHFQLLNMVLSLLWPSYEWWFAMEMVSMVTLQIESSFVVGLGYCLCSTSIFTPNRVRLSDQYCGCRFCLG